MLARSKRDFIRSVRSHAVHVKSLGVKCHARLYSRRFCRQVQKSAEKGLGGPCHRPREGRGGGEEKSERETSASLVEGVKGRRNF